MFKLLFGFFIILGLIVLLVLSFGFSLLRAIFGIRNKHQQTQGDNSQPMSESKNKDKIFDKSEGEYVDFEEVKGEEKTKEE